MVKYGLQAGLRVLPTLAAAVLAVYAAEAYLRLAETDQPAANGGVRDTRTRLEVVQDLRREGTDAYPAIFPRALMQLDADGKLRSMVRLDGQEFLPLGGISRRVTVTCNEGGTYAVYQSDEHGFNNPEGLWEADEVQIAAIGDSYTYGNCVAADDGFVARLRAQYPTTINLGLGGIGPLLELAVLREYGAVLRPRLTLWMFYEGNDLIELEEERRSPLLLAQLAGEPPQGLMTRQAEIDRELMAFVDERVEAAPPRRPVLEFLRLSKLRERLRQTLQPAGETGGPPVECDFDLLRQVLSAAKSTAASWGGEIALVYLPGRDRYFGSPDSAVRSEGLRTEVAAAAAAAGMAMLDLVPVFAAHDAPVSLFVDANSHWNEKGNAFVADAILHELSGIGVAEALSADAGRSAAADAMGDRQ